MGIQSETETGIAPTFAAGKYNWLRQHLEINLSDLPEQLSQVTVIIDMAAQYATAASEIARQEKDKLAVVYSQVANRLRLDKLDGGKERSETRIGTEQPMQPEVIAQQEVVAETRLDAELWGSRFEALRTKAAVLRTTADMMQAGFISPDYIRDKARPIPYTVRQVAITQDTADFFNKARETSQ